MVRSPAESGTRFEAERAPSAVCARLHVELQLIDGVGREVLFSGKVGEGVDWSPN